MYWHDLNEKRIQQLRNWLQGKRLLIVGNSVKLLHSECGQLIDSYDAVVRIGKGLPSPKLENKLGNKMDIWFSGMLRAGLYSRVNCQWKILTPSTSSTYDDSALFIPTNKALFSTNFQPYKHYFWSDSVESTKAFWSLLGFTKDVRPSQGIICVDFFARRVKHTNIDIIGFDFFTETINIGGVEYNSWHMPSRITANETAHNGSIERHIVEALVENSLVNLLEYK